MGYRDAYVPNGKEIGESTTAAAMLIAWPTIDATLPHYPT
jgi:hypothetical protein